MTLILEKQLSGIRMADLGSKEILSFLTSLMDYQYSLLRNIPADKLLTGIDIATGFSLDMIKTIVEHMEYINNLDVLREHFTFLSEAHLI